MIVDNISARHIERVAWRAEEKPQGKARGAIILFYFIPVIFLKNKDREGKARRKYKNQTRSYADAAFAHSCGAAVASL